MSLDGFIADTKGGHDWIIMDPSFDFAGFMAEFDTVLLGRKTYEATRGMGGSGMPGMRAVVCSTTLNPAVHADIEVVPQAEAFVRELKQAPGKDVWLFGGGGLFGTLLDSGVVDQIEVSLIPIMLGEGVPLIPAGVRPVVLRLLESKTLSNGTVCTRYEPK